MLAHRVDCWQASSPAGHRKGTRAMHKTAIRHTTRTKVVIYIRISKDRDGQHSTANQEREARAYAASRGWEVVAVLADIGLSAFKKGKVRPGFNDAKQMIHAGQAEVLLVWKIDRLARRVKEGIRVRLELEDAGGYIASVTEPIDMTEDGDWQPFIMFLTFAESESASKAVRTKSFNDGRLLEGLPPCGPRPYGYNRVEGALVINEDEALIIKQFAHQFLHGGTIKGFIRKNQPKGTQGGVMAPQAFRNIFNSPTVTGHRELPGGKLHKGNWPAILPLSEWEAVRVKMADPERATHVGNEVKHMLTGKGIMTCGACGHDQMSVRRWKQNATSRKAASAGYRYTCTACGNNSAWQEAVDQRVTELVLAEITPAKWTALLSQGQGVNSAEVQRLEQEADSLSIAALDPSPAFKNITMATIQPRLEAINAELALAMGETQLDLPRVKNLHTAWPTMGPLDKRKVLKATCSSIMLEPANGRRDPAARVKVQLASSVV